MCVRENNLIVPLTGSDCYYKCLTTVCKSCIELHDVQILFTENEFWAKVNYNDIMMCSNVSCKLYFFGKKLEDIQKCFHSNKKIDVRV